jgi:phenylpyruvate tautomerase PptA (4-oxalocrotonate tautomerase family)
MAKNIKIVTEAICEDCRLPPEAVIVIIEDIDRKS